MSKCLIINISKEILNEFKYDYSYLKEEDLEIPFSDVDFGKEGKTSLDDLIKSAVEKAEEQPIKNNPVKEMER